MLRNALMSTVSVVGSRSGLPERQPRVGYVPVRTNRILGCATAPLGMTICSCEALHAKPNVALPAWPGILECESNIADKPEDDVAELEPPIHSSMAFIAAVLLWCSAALLLLVAAKWIDPPTTAVQIERRVQSWTSGKPYQKRYKFVPLNQISPDLQHAVIAAEDARFYLHHGFDWRQIEIAAQEDMEGERTRGASTLTQQLVKNLLFGTSRSIIRKGVETTLVPVAEFVLGKRRILELYLNVVEWGPGDLWCGCRVPVLRQNLGPDDGRGNSRRSSPQFCLLRRSVGPSACTAIPRSSSKRMSQVGW